MLRLRYPKWVVGSGFAVGLLSLLLGCFMLTTTVRAQSTVEPVLEPVGSLVFTNSTETPAGAFQLVITGLATLPADSHYVLWLHGEQTATLNLGPLTVTNGTGARQGSIDHNLLVYDQAVISIETEDEPADISDEVVLTATLPAPLHAALAPLLVEVGTADVPIAPTSGFLTSAQSQVQIVVQHTGFLRDALGEIDLPQARRHTEHIINILDGESGFMYSDLDRDGRTENPGDGFGIRSYLDEARTRALDLVDVTEELALSGTQSTDALAIVTAIEAGQSAIAGSFDNALQIFASDTVTEASVHAKDLTVVIDGLAQELATAYTKSLAMATYTFYAPVRVATPTPIPPTQTATRTPSPSPSPTPRPATPTRTSSPTEPPATATLKVATPKPTVVLQPTATPTVISQAASSTLVAAPTIEINNVTVGESWRNPADGSLYVHVPAGEFQMGSTTDEAVSPREEPQHNASVAEFWLQQTETTNGQYARCVAADVCTPPTNDRWDDPAYLDHPVTDIDWQQATVYAAWVGGRLPTEAEWEKACRSTDARAFPWGDEPPTDTLSNYNNDVGDTTPVGSYPAGASPLGIVDLSGNVWEWVSSLDADYPYDASDGREDPTDLGKRIVRGGSFYYTQYQIRCAARTGFTPDTASQHTGIRVVIDQPVTELINDMDGARYLYVPGGEFTMGSPAETAASPREVPAHAVSVDAFWLQQTETTNAQYARCVAADVCTPPANTRWEEAAYADYPVADVDWQQANAYAAWVGGRLPTEAEWEKACRSTDARAFPWGDEPPTDTRSNYNNDVGDTTPVGSYPAGASPFGLLDLSGNVWEWVSSLDADYPYDASDGREDATDPGKRIVRGGSFYYTQYQIRCAARTGFTPDTASQHTGFRVVLAAQ